MSLSSGLECIIKHQKLYFFVFVFCESLFIFDLVVFWLPHTNDGGNLQVSLVALLHVCCMEVMQRGLEQFLVPLQITACLILVFMCLGMPFLVGTALHHGFHTLHGQPFVASSILKYFHFLLWKEHLIHSMPPAFLYCSVAFVVKFYCHVMNQRIS